MQSIFETPQRTSDLSAPPAGSPALRTVIITGGNSGLGYACARTLVGEGSADIPWHVVLACRDPSRAQTAVEALRAEASAAGSLARVDAMQLDLASLRSVRNFTSKLAARLEKNDLPPLHAVVCNAGVQSGGVKTFTADGFESTFGINHLGHFLLVNQLLPFLAPPARLIIVASGVHDPAQKTPMPVPSWNNPTDLARGELGESAAADSPVRAGRRRYATSKLANVLFTYELARRLPAGTTANAFDPGLMPGTGLAREAAAPLRWLWHYVLPAASPLLRRFVSPNVHTPAQSGAALARLVYDPALAGHTSKYFEGLREIRSSVESYDASRAAQLWQASEALTAAEPNVLGTRDATASSSSRPRGAGLLIQT